MSKPTITTDIEFGATLLCGYDPRNDAFGGQIFKSGPDVKWFSNDRALISQDTASVADVLAVVSTRETTAGMDFSKLPWAPSVLSSLSLGFSKKLTAHNTATMSNSVSVLVALKTVRAATVTLTDKFVYDNDFLLALNDTKVPVDELFARFPPAVATQAISGGMKTFASLTSNLSSTESSELQRSFSLSLLGLSLKDTTSPTRSKELTDKIVKEIRVGKGGDVLASDSWEKSVREAPALLVTEFMPLHKVFAQCPPDCKDKTRYNDVVKASQERFAPPATDHPDEIKTEKPLSNDLVVYFSSDQAANPIAAADLQIVSNRRVIGRRIIVSRATLAQQDLSEAESKLKAAVVDFRIYSKTGELVSDYDPVGHIRQHDELVRVCKALGRL